jgi:DNA-binding transcriptional LysR family regulator
MRSIVQSLEVSRDQGKRTILLPTLARLKFVPWTLDPRHLLTLEAVVRLRSFAAAADALGYTQSAVSQQIAELERRIGVRVVDRRPVRPTAAGSVLLAAEASIQAAMSTTAAELAALDKGLTGTVRLGAFVSAAVSIVPAALTELRTSNPGVQVILRQLETADSYAALLRGDLDLAVTFDYDRALQPEPEGIVRRLIRTDPVLIALPASHPLAGQETVDPAQVESDAWITTPVTAPHLNPTAGAPAAGARPSLELQGDDFRTALRLVAEGLGAALLPELALTDAPPGVIGRPLAGAPLTRYVYLCRIQSHRVPAPIAQLEKYLTSGARRLPHEPTGSHRPDQPPGKSPITPPSQVRDSCRAQQPTTRYPGDVAVTRP